MESVNQSENMKSLLESSTEPLLFNNLLTWNLLQWDMTKWNECLGDTQLQFRMGHKAFTKEPQWEKTCELVKGTFADFRNFNEPKKWLYFDYKYLNQWFIEKYDLRNEINWAQLGYPNIRAEDSTIWIGSEGAHTPCHIDSYGFNLIAQIAGRKLWLLFPPQTNLQPTRVPYEESTIYSAINFFSPSDDDCFRGGTAKKVVLEPGQILFVPNGWWHYVENLETAISINTWIPASSDGDNRIDEAITLAMVKMLSQGLRCEEQAAIINNHQDLQELTNLEAINLIESSLQSCNRDKCTPITNIVANDGVEVIETLTPNELQQFLQKQRQRFPLASGDKGEQTEENSNKSLQLMKTYLSVLTDPEVVTLVKRKLQLLHDTKL